MSDTSGAAWLTGEEDDSRPTATGTITETDIEIEVVDVTEEQLEALEGSLDDEDDEADLETKDNAIRDFLVAVDGEDPPTPEEMLMRRKNLLWVSMCQIWGGMQDIQPAMEQMQLPQGNR